MGSKSSGWWYLNSVGVYFLFEFHNYVICFIFDFQSYLLGVVNR